MGLFSRITNNVKNFGISQWARNFKSGYEEGNLEKMNDCINEMHEYDTSDYFTICSKRIYLMRSEQLGKFTEDYVTNIISALNFENDIELAEKLAREKYHTSDVELIDWFSNTHKALSDLRRKSD